MLRSAPRRWRPAVALGGAALVLVACSPRAPQLCDRIEPLLRAPRFGFTTPERPVVTLYEYAPGTEYLITGKSISFTAPRDFQGLNWSEARGGPQYLVGFHYRIAGRAPQGRPVFARSAYSHDGSGFTDDISVKLYAQTRMGVLTTKSGDMGRPEPDRCGLKVTSFAPAVDLHQSPELVRQWPYGARSVVLRGLTKEGSYRRYIVCHDAITLSGTAVCTIFSDYRGWPMEIWFNDGRVCEADQRVADARAMYDRNFVSETPRAPGFQEGAPWEKDHNCPRAGSFSAWWKSAFNKN